MRTLLALFLGVIAVLATLFAVPAMWIERHVADEDGYVELVGPLGDDPDFQAELARTLGNRLVQDLEVPDSIRDATRESIESAALAVTELDGYREAWAESQRRSHRLTLGGETDDEGRVVADIAPLSELVVDEANAVLPVTLESPGQILVPIGAEPQPEALETLRT